MSGAEPDCGGGVPEGEPGAEEPGEPRHQGAVRPARHQLQSEPEQPGLNT